MNPIKRELLNGLFVLVLASLMSAVFAAFQIKFNVLLWVLILMAIAVAVGGYVVFEFVLSAEQRETELLKRVGTPAKLEMNPEGPPLGTSILEALMMLSPGSDYTVIYYFNPQGGGQTRQAEETR